MVIALPYNEEDKNINAHFGHCTKMALYEIDETGAITDSAIVGTYGEGHFAMYELLEDYNVEVLICQNIGEEAARLMQMGGITVYAGVEGSPEEAVKLLIEDMLSATEGSHGCGGCSGGDCSTGSCNCSGGCCH